MDTLFAVVWADGRQDDRQGRFQDGRQDAAQDTPDDGETGATDPVRLRAVVSDAVAAPLSALGVSRYLLNIRDAAVAGAVIDVRTTERPLLAALRVRVPVASATACAGLLDALGRLGPVSARSVTASEPLPVADPGAAADLATGTVRGAETDQVAEGMRCDGMANLAFLRRPERIDKDDWLRIWLEEHTQVAIDTQSTTGYTQHVVVRALTADAPRIDGIVEEIFPIGAVSDLGVFFDSGGDESRMSANVKAMTASTGRFLDDGTTDAVPTGRYVMGVRCTDV